jgi:hypothetical protein
MPSRKKAQDQARKAEQKRREAEQKEQDCVHHNTPAGCTDADTKICLSLLTALDLRVDSIILAQDGDSSYKYNQFNDVMFSFYDNEYTKLNDKQQVTRAFPRHCGWLWCSLLSC